MSKSPESTRAKNIALIKEASDEVRELADDLKEATLRRNRAMIDAHGKHSEGGLSYNDIAEASGLMRTRVIQVIQPVKTGKEPRP